jgi:hypothetical protein
VAGRAVFPGSFDPLTVGHLAVADAAREQLAVDAVDLVISQVALAKEDRVTTSVDDRLAAIGRVRDAGRPWLGARSTTDQLLADIARGYDVLVIGADKWHQLLDVAFYGGSSAGRDEALSRLPLVAVAPRAGAVLRTADVRGDVALRILDVPPAVHAVSSTAVRGGRNDWRA